MKKYILSILTATVIIISVVLVQRALATPVANSYFSIAAAHGQYTSLYCVIVHRDKAVAVTNAGVDTTDGAWTTLDVAGTYDEVLGEWKFAIPSATPASGKYKGKIMNRSAPGAEVNEDSILAQVVFDIDENSGVTNFQQIE